MASWEDFISEWSPLHRSRASGTGSHSSWTFHASDLFDGISPDEADALTDWARVRRELAKKKQPRRSLLQVLKNAGEVGLKPAEFALDKVMRSSYAVNEGIRAALGGGGHWGMYDLNLGAAAHGLREGFMGRKKTSFDDVLKQEGVLEGHGRLRGLAGFIGDVALDPTTYATFGTGAIVRGGSKGAFVAGRQVMKDLGPVKTAAEAQSHLERLMPQLATLREAGPAFRERAALGETRKGILEDVLRGADEPNYGLLSHARAGAQAEEKAMHKRGLTVGLDLPFTNRTVRTAPLPLPVPGLRTATKLPVLGKGLHTLGEAFSPGFRDPIAHAHEMVKTHHGEELTHHYFQTLRDTFDGLENLSQRKQVEALHFFEKVGRDGTPSVIKQGGRFVLNPKRVEQARKSLSDDQIEFVERWHEATEFLAERDRMHGLEYTHMGEQGRVYAPHILKRDGEVPSLTAAQRNLLSQRGFVKRREGEYSIAELAKLRDWGKLGRDIVTNPFELLAMRASSGAKQHADLTMAEFLKRTHGIQTRLVDKEALGAAERRLEDLPKIIEEHPGRPENKEWLDTEYVLERKKLQTKLLADNLRKQKRAKLPETVQRLQAEAKHIVDTIDERPELLALKEQHKAAKAEFRQLKNELAKKAPRAIRELRKGVKNPDYDPMLHSKLENRSVRDEFDHDYAFDPEIHAALTRLQPVVNGDPQVLKQLGNSYRKYYGKWKMAVTVLNPFGYGARNTVSDFWNMYIRGVPARQIPHYGARAAMVLRRAKQGDAKAIAQIVEMYHQGVLSGLYDGDVLKVASMIHQSGSKRAFVKKGKPIGLVNKIAQDINRNRENWGRMTHYMYRRQGQRLSAAEAADHVKAAHFDYEDLAPADRWLKDNVVPFWTWTRKNIPFQLQAVLSRPGKYSTFPKAVNAIEGDTADGDIVPDFVRQRMMVKAGGRYFNPMVGVTDLNKLDPRTAGREAINMVNPALKVPFELALNKSALTGREIAGTHERNPVNEKFARFLALIPGSNVGPTERSGVRGTGAAPWLTHLLGSTPQTNRFINQKGRIKSQTGSEKSLPLSVLGLDGTRIDQKKQREFAEIELDQQATAELRRLRDMGLIAPAKKRKKSKSRTKTDRMLIQMLEGR